MIVALGQSKFAKGEGKRTLSSEAESKEKHGEWDPMPLTITSPSVDSRVDYNTFTMGNPMPEPTLSPSQRL